MTSHPLLRALFSRALSPVAVAALVATGAVMIAVSGLSASATAQVVGRPAGEAQPEPAADPDAPVTGQDGTDQAGEPAQTQDDPATPVQGRAVNRRSMLDPFAAMLTRRGPSAVRLFSPSPQLYKTTEGDETFVFQSDGQTGYIRFPCETPEASLECALLRGNAEEIVILDAVRSPRGDITYVSQGGSAILRVTSNGGATLFADGDAPVGTADDDWLVPTGGRAVLPVSELDGALGAPPMRFAMASQRMQRAADLLNDRHDTMVTFMMAPEVPQAVRRGDQAVLADAVLTVAKGIDAVADDPLGARIVAQRLAVVEFAPGEPGLALNEGTLTVSYDPAGGLEGRPSSWAVARYLESSL